MKILILGSSSSIHATRLANEMAKRKHEVHFVSMHPFFDPLDTHVRYHRLPFPANIGYYVNLPALSGLVKNIRPDIINAHYASGYGTLARLLNFDKTVISVWGSDVYDFPFQGKWKFRIVKKNLQFACCIFSTSHTMKEHIEKLFHVRTEVAVTPFGVDCEIFAPRGEKRDTFRVGTVKSLYPTYGISDLVKAFVMAKDRGMQNAELIIIGDGEQRGELEELCHSFKVQDSVRFVGKIPHGDVPNWLNTFDVFAALSRFESFGVSIIEASACGLPVVVSNAGGLPEVVKDGETGYMVPTCDPDSAANKILSLYGSAELRERMGKNGRNFVLSRYEWSKNVDHIERLYRTVVGR